MRSRRTARRCILKAVVGGGLSGRLIGTMAALGRFIRYTSWQGALILVLIVAMLVVGIRILNHG